jgi:ribonucleotide reductase beta subunit family protein with ferritin-like domain
LEEAGREIVKNKETKEYKRWRKENKQLLKKAKKFLKEFYKNRKVASFQNILSASVSLISVFSFFVPSGLSG